jgi:cytochrome P450
MPHLLEHSALLASLYDKLLRLANAPTSSRVVASEAVIGRKLLRPGCKLLMSYRQLHFDPRVFGANAAHFDAARFLNNKGLARSTSYRPPGGAATHCPGKFLARWEVYMFVVLVLRWFDINLEGVGGEKPRFPRMHETIPSGGMMGPVTGDDVFVKVRQARR